MSLRRFLRLLVCVAGLGGCTQHRMTNPLDPPSAAMRAIVHGRLEAAHDLIKTGLVKLDWDHHQIQALDKDSMEVYHQPIRAEIMDDFDYTVYRATSGNRFFIVQSGGFAGVTNVYSNVK